MDTLEKQKRAVTHTPSPLIARDQKAVWHPLTQYGLEEVCLPVARAKDALLILEDGREIIDAISSWWVTLHGHAHPVIAQAIFEQAKQLEQVIFARFTHAPAVTLAEILTQAAQNAGAALTRCFYSDAGATAVEIALKLAYQYHKNKGVQTRTRFLALTDAYHGDTLGAMAVSARGNFHAHFSELLPAVDFVSTENTDQLAQYLQQSPETYAALIVEPMVQGAAGMKIHSAAFLSQAAALCKKAGVLFICDEVFTGFYRTGTCFAFEHAGVQPDIVCLGKGLSGGFLPLAATLTTEDIFSVFRSDSMRDAFFHGHSFTGNPIACAAAIASWHLLQEKNTQTAIQEISRQTQARIAALSTHKNCVAARALGTIGAVEMRGLPDYMSSNKYEIFAYAIQQGVLLRPLGSVLYAVPPYCTTASQLDKIYNTIEMILDGKYT